MLKIREGIICENVCGEHILVAARPAAPFCKRRAILLSEEAFFLWNLLENGVDEETLIEKFCEHYEVSETQVSDDVQAFCEKMTAAGYLVQTEEAV